MVFFDISYVVFPLILKNESYESHVSIHVNGRRTSGVVNVSRVRRSSRANEMDIRDV